MLFANRYSKHAGFSAGHVRFLVDILSYSCWLFPRCRKIRHPISYQPNFHWCWQPSNPTSSCSMSKSPSLAAPIPFFPCFNKSSLHCWLKSKFHPRFSQFLPGKSPFFSRWATRFFDHVLLTRWPTIQPADFWHGGRILWVLPGVGPQDLDGSWLKLMNSKWLGFMHVPAKIWYSFWPVPKWICLPWEMGLPENWVYHQRVSKMQNYRENDDDPMGFRGIWFLFSDGHKWRLYTHGGVHTKSCVSLGMIKERMHIDVWTKNKVAESLSTVTTSQ